MRKMKKWISLLLLITMALSLFAGCGSEQASDADTALAVLKEQGIDAYLIGTIIKGEEKVILE